MTYSLNTKLHIEEHDDNTTFVTTAIDYPNALPHIGTAFEKIGADVYARFRRSQGREVYFLMGNDENTAKVVKAAEDTLFGNRKDRWELPRQDYQNYVNIMADKFKVVWQQLGISYDDFIQTSEERHRIGVQYFLNAVNKAGFIEKRPYKALYCEGCEEFKSPGSLVAERCPNHPGSPLIERQEENYFFLLSKFQQWVADLLTPTPFVSMFLSVEPAVRENEVNSFVADGLQDISISRKNEGWGIPIPWDESQVTYVWFDALLNYLTGIGFGTDWEKFEKFWPAEVHFIGKDITRFHCALFPAMLEAYNRGEVDHKLKAFPVRVFAHGFIYQKKGNTYVKSSKSGDALNPVDLINQFGADAYRYYFLSKCNYDTDGEFSLEHFKEVYNSDLANSLGNLVSRVHSMSVQYFGGDVPAGNISSDKNIWLNPEKLDDYESFIVAACSFRHALEMTRDIVARANQYIDAAKPWELAKIDKVMTAHVLRTLLGNLRIVALLLKPFLPETAEKIYNAVQWNTPWENTSWETLKELADNNFLGLYENIKVNGDKFLPLFPRLKKDE